jgi:hypothetical protein
MLLNISTRERKRACLAVAEVGLLPFGLFLYFTSAVILGHANNRGAIAIFFGGLMTTVWLFVRLLKGTGAWKFQYGVQ